MKKRHVLIFIAIALMIGIGCSSYYLAVIDYLPRLLSSTQYITIRDCPKLGSALLAKVTDPREVKRFVAATHVRFIESECACFGFTDVEYHLISGEVVTLNYKSGEGGELYIKFPYHGKTHQATPSPEFMALVKSYTK